MHLFSTGIALSIVFGRHNCLFILLQSVLRPPIGLFTFCRMIRLPDFGGGDPENGADVPEIRTLAKLLYNTPTNQVSSSYVQYFWSYRVDKQNNKVILWKKNIHLLCYATSVEN